MGGHELTQYTATPSTHCDCCGWRIKHEHQKKTFRCTLCNYDLCSKCVAGEDDSLYYYDELHVLKRKRKKKHVLEPANAVTAAAAAPIHTEELTDSEELRQKKLARIERFKSHVD